MKRETFEIKANGVICDWRTKWNSSIRFVEGKIKEIAMAEETVYELVDSVSNKEGFSFTNGSRTWKSKTGSVIKFEINRI